MLGDLPGGLNATEMAQRLGVDKSSAHRMLATLEAAEFVRMDPGTRRYRLGLRLVGLGAAALRGADISEISRPVLRALADETREASHLAVLSHGQVLFLAKADAPDGTLTVNTSVGSRTYVHCTSLGKVLLAGVEDEAEVDGMLRFRSAPRFTARTITDTEDLKRHVRQVRARGYAIDDEERDIGLRCIAAPVRDAAGTVVAAVGISGPTARVSLDRLDGLIDRVQQAAIEVSHALGYAAPDPRPTLPDRGQPTWTPRPSSLTQLADPGSPK